MERGSNRVNVDAKRSWKLRGKPGQCTPSEVPHFGNSSCRGLWFWFCQTFLPNLENANVVPFVRWKRMQMLPQTAKNLIHKTPKYVCWPCVKLLPNLENTLFEMKNAANDPSNNTKTYSKDTQICIL